MKAISQPMTALIRVFDLDSARMGDKWILAVHASYYDEGRVVYLSGLQGGITRLAKKALLDLFRAECVKYVRWSHTNNRDHEVHVCCDVATGRLKLE